MATVEQQGVGDRERIIADVFQRRGIDPAGPFGKGLWQAAVAGTWARLPDAMAREVQELAGAPGNNEGPFGGDGVTEIQPHQGESGHWVGSNFEHGKPEMEFAGEPSVAIEGFDSRTDADRDQFPDITQNMVEVAVDEQASVHSGKSLGATYVDKPNDDEGGAVTIIGIRADESIALGTQFETQIDQTRVEFAAENAVLAAATTPAAIDPVRIGDMVASTLRRLYANGNPVVSDPSPTAQGIIEAIDRMRQFLPRDHTIMADAAAMVALSAAVDSLQVEFHRSLRSVRSKAMAALDAFETGVPDHLVDTIRVDAERDPEGSLPPMLRLE